MRKFIENIRSKPESDRRRAALGASLLVTTIIFATWVGTKGWINFGTPEKKMQTAQVIDAKSAISPFDSSKRTIQEVGSGIESAYRDFKESVSRVLVPFVTGIEIYERK